MSQFSHDIADGWFRRLVFEPCRERLPDSARHFIARGDDVDLHKSLEFGSFELRQDGFDLSLHRAPPRDGLRWFVERQELPCMYERHLGDDHSHRTSVGLAGVDVSHSLSPRDHGWMQRRMQHSKYSDNPDQWN